MTLNVPLNVPMDAAFQRHVIKIDMAAMTQTEVDEFIRLWRKAQVTVSELDSIKASEGAPKQESK